MNTEAFSFRQEMPPPNGYPPIQRERIRNYRFYGNYAFFTLSTLYTVWWSYRFVRVKERRNLRHLEVYNCLIALEPFMEAERDRLYLKNIINLREEEMDTMKRFKDWIPGTLYGVPIYNTLLPEQQRPMNLTEYLTFRPKRDRHRYWMATMTSYSGQ